MNIENQVTNLEVSKKLKELGVEQESIFSWIQTYDPTLAPILNHSIARTPDVRGDLYLVDKSPNERNYSAFTTSELAEIIFKSVPSGSYVLEAYGYVFNVPKTRIITEMGLIECMRNPEIAAKMLIYLKENKLI